MSRYAPPCPSTIPLAAVEGPLGPEDFDGVPVISYHPVQARYFHELTVRFLANGHPRIEQHVQQILTAVLLVSANQGVALVPASAAALGVAGVRYKALTDLGGGHPESDPSRPVELHAMWVRGGMTPMLRQVLAPRPPVRGARRRDRRRSDRVMLSRH